MNLRAQIPDVTGVPLHQQPKAEPPSTLRFLIPTISDAPIAQATQPVAPLPPRVPRARIVEDYQLGRSVGEGHFGKVKLARHLTTNAIVALKIIEYDPLNRERQQRLMAREIEALQNLRHENVIRLNRVVRHAQLPSQNGFKEVLLLDLELAPKGELFDYLLHGGSLPEHIARVYASQLLSALRECHARGIYHRDIKPDNLLLGANFELKVADFGLAAISPESSVLSTACGTEAYQAPEVLSRVGHYDGAKVDSWAAGVVMFILIVGRPPVTKATSHDYFFGLMEQGNWEDFWIAHQSPDISDRAKEMFGKVLVANPEQRCSVDELIQDPWIQTSQADGEDAARVREFMSARDKTIAHTREQAKQAARKRKSSSIGQSTPFENRKSGKEDEAVDQGSLPPLLEREVEENPFQLFVCHDDASKTLQTLKDAVDCQLNLSSKMDRDEFLIDVSHTAFKATLQMWRMDGEDSDLLCVQFDRLEGDPWTFKDSWSCLEKSLTTLGVIGQAGGEEPLDDGVDVEF